MPAAICAGRQCRRPKRRKSILPPRPFGNRIGLTEAGSRSSASTAFACNGTARVLSRVFVFLRNFPKPSSGLEPETPSLPWNVARNRLQSTATVLACFSRFRA
jgi:hypothetical protein